MLISNTNQTFKAIADFMYPVGSYYITESSDLNTVAKMNAYFGGTWVALDAGRFLEAGTTVANKAAGLPNITGMATLSSGIWDKITLEGCFYQTDGITNHAGHTGSSFSQKGYKVRFDASKGGSTLYGASTTVQPKSRTVYIYRRTALSKEV